MYGLEYWMSFLSVPAPYYPHLAFGRTCMLVWQGGFYPCYSSPSVVDWCFWLLCERFVLEWVAVGVLSSPTSPLRQTQYMCVSLVGFSQCFYSSLIAMSVMYLLGILDGRELSAPLLMLVDLLGLRVFYCFFSKCQWDFQLLLLQQLYYFVWVLEAGRFPLLSPGEDGLC